MCSREKRQNVQVSVSLQESVFVLIASSTVKKRKDLLMSNLSAGATHLAVRLQARVTLTSIS